MACPCNHVTAPRVVAAGEVVVDAVLAELTLDKNIVPGVLPGHHAM